MDHLSLTANIVTVIQATYEVISICQNYRAARKNSMWELSKIIEELKCVRNVLESLETLADRLENGEYTLHFAFLIMTSYASYPSGSGFGEENSLFRILPV